VGKRRKAREIVLQASYAARQSGASLTSCLDDQLARRGPADETAAFARELSSKLSAHRREVERWLGSLLENWRPERVGVLERVVLQLGLTELRHSPDVPWRVVVNEACELARRYCDEDAVGFVNGILDRAAAQVLRETGGDEKGEPADPGEDPA